MAKNGEQSFDSQVADMNRELDRECLGVIVRDAWVKWAKTQPNPKPSWLVPWNDLNELDREADRCIGEAVAYAVRTPQVNATALELAETAVSLAHRWFNLRELKRDIPDMHLMHDGDAMARRVLDLVSADAVAKLANPVAAKPSPDETGAGDDVVCKGCGISAGMSHTKGCPTVDGAKSNWVESAASEILLKLFNEASSKSYANTSFVASIIRRHAPLPSMPAASQIETMKRDLSKIADDLDKIEMMKVIRGIAAVVGCGHVDDSDGRRKLVRCVEEAIAAARKLQSPNVVVADPFRITERLRIFKEQLEWPNKDVASAFIDCIINDIRGIVWNETMGIAAVANEILEYGRKGLIACHDGQQSHWTKIIDFSDKLRTIMPVMEGPNYAGHDPQPANVGDELAVQRYSPSIGTDLFTPDPNGQFCKYADAIRAAAEKGRGRG